MENTLERMVERIYQEGIGRAEDKARAVLADAEKRAAEKVTEATAEAERIVRQARDEATSLRRATESELAGLAQKALTQLRHEIQTLLVASAISDPLTETLRNSDFLRDLFLRLAEKADSKDFVVTVPEAMRAELTQSLKTALAGRLPNLMIEGGSLKGGFTVEARAGGYQVEFTDAALTRFLEPYLKPATAALFAKGNGQG